MEGDRVFLGRLIPFSLLGDDMHQDGALEALDVLQSGEEMVKAMAVDGSDIQETELFKQQARYEQSFSGLLHAVGRGDQWLPDPRNGRQDPLRLLLDLGIEWTGHNSRKGGREGPH